MHFLVVLSFSLFVFLSTPVAAQGLLPAGGEDAAYTHVHDKFMDVLERHEALREEENATLCARSHQENCGYLKFQDKVDSLRGYNGVDLLRKVDALFNRLTYTLDADLYGLEEYWATPAEFVAKGAGDCEDYALAKYHALKELGWSPADMTVVVLWDKRARLHHAVLLVKHEGEEWLLDDANTKLIPSHEVQHYLPLYSVNEHKSYYYHLLYS